VRYEEILTRALAVSWRHKYLWLLALLAGEGAAFGVPSMQNSLGGNNAGHGYGPGAAGITPAQFGAWISAHAALLWTAAAVLAIAVIALFLISAIANGAIIRGAAEHDLEQPFSLSAAWRAGVGTFRPVLAMKLLALGVTLALVVTIGSLVLATAGAVMGHQIPAAVTSGVAAGLLLLAAIPFWIVFAVAVLFAQRAIVLEGMRPLAALRAGFALIRRRLGRVALVWLLVAVLTVLAGIAARIALIIVALPLAGIVAAAYFTGGLQLAIGIGVVVGAVWLAVALAVSGAVSAYASTVWTLAYRRFDQEAQPVPAAVGPAPA
jgi:hypothetical protein